jgi:hypothetical protein
MCADYILALPRTAQVDLGDEPLPEVVLSQMWPHGVNVGQVGSDPCRHVRESVTWGMVGRA